MLRFSYCPTLLLLLFLGGPLALPAQAQKALEEVKLVAPDGRRDDFFGVALATDGKTAVVGANSHDLPGLGGTSLNVGAVYVFERSDQGWEMTAKLIPPDGNSWDRFGSAVAIQGDDLLVGSPGDDDRSSNAGAVYYYQRAAEGWSLEAKLYADAPEKLYHFGVAVDLDGDYAIAGSGDDSNYGAAYVFVREDGKWRQQAYLAPADLPDRHFLGRRVAIDGNVALVGTWRDDHAEPAQGRVYTFVRAGETWREEATLYASDGNAGNYFGARLALDGDYALIGAYKADPNAKDAGAAYVFHRTDKGWTEQARLTASDFWSEDYLGWDVALDDTLALVGAPRGNDQGPTSGAVYLFERTGEAWSEVAKLIASDGKAEDFFGYSVALADSQMLVGAVGDDSQASIAGAAYAYTLPLAFAPPEDPPPDDTERPQGVSTDPPPGAPALALAPAYPNPSRARTRIAYTLPAAQHVVLHVYDLLGREVATLAEGRKPAGRHELVFETAGLPAGRYLYRLTAGAHAEAGTLVVAK